ncbi:DUF2845 domain-containing protein [Anaeromyxobacter terrae]|uniref:DUF2845 domain-containing protein n=1 Tax=Anaeromyxobacter terrae TaxID=2925406 RepID=UPI001F583DF9|nr:DUF2845 domain-containing protein [Anaeromyxobacter sp. SG22]
MNTTARCALALVFLAAATASRASESSLRCDRGVISLGDSQLDVLGKCGEPALRDSRTEESATAVRDEGSRAVSGVRVSTVVHAWTYNFGPQRFMYVVTLEGGKVIGIERGSYGYESGDVAAARESKPASCDSSRLKVGDLKLDLLARCGEPAAKDVRQVQRLEASESTITAERSVEVDVWTYDFGPNQFVHIVTLENGKVVAVERGGYGYQR